MVIPKRHRIILKSKTAGNSEDRPHNSAIIFEYISLVNLLAVLVFQSSVLADGVSDNTYFITVRRMMIDYDVKTVECYE